MCIKRMIRIMIATASIILMSACNVKTADTNVESNVEVDANELSGEDTDTEDSTEEDGNEEESDEEEIDFPDAPHNFEVTIPDTYTKVSDDQAVPDYEMYRDEDAQLTILVNTAYLYNKVFCLPKNCAEMEMNAIINGTEDMQQYAINYGDSIEFVACEPVDIEGYDDSYMLSWKEDDIYYEKIFVWENYCHAVYIVCGYDVEEVHNTAVSVAESSEYIGDVCVYEDSIDLPGTDYSYDLPEGYVATANEKFNYITIKATGDIDFDTAYFYRCEVAREEYADPKEKAEELNEYQNEMNDSDNEVAESTLGEVFGQVEQEFTDIPVYYICNAVEAEDYTLKTEIYFCEYNDSLYKITIVYPE